MNPILFLGALLGLMAVMMAAYVDHVLGANLTQATLGILDTALRYHALYAILIAALGLSLYAPLPPRLLSHLSLCAWAFIIGILLFSFGIYASVLTGFTAAVRVTPIGGVLLMLGWLILLSVALLKVRRERFI